MVVRLEPGGLLIARLAGALWLLLEWLVIVISTVITFAWVFTDGDLSLDGDDSPMRLLDWLDAGTFTIWSVILLVAPLVSAIGIFLSLRGELGGWVRKFCFAVVGGNLLGAIWWWVSLSDGSTPAADIFVTAGMLFTAAVAMVMALSAPRSAQPVIA